MIVFKTLSTHIISANRIRRRESLPTSSLRVCVCVCVGCVYGDPVSYWVWVKSFAILLCLSTHLRCNLLYVCVYVCVIKVLCTCARSQLCVCVCVRYVWEVGGVRAVRMSLLTSWFNSGVVNRSSGEHVEPPQSPQQESVPQLQALQPHSGCQRAGRLRGPHQDLYQAMELHAGQTHYLFLFHVFVFLHSAGFCFSNLRVKNKDLNRCVL